MDKVQLEAWAREFNGVVHEFVKTHPGIGVIASVGADLGNATIALLPHTISNDVARRMLCEMVTDFEESDRSAGTERKSIGD